MKRILFFLSVVCIASNIQATVVTNATKYDVELKVTYAEKCLVEGYDSSNPKYSEFKAILPASSKMDISANSVQSRQKSGCYKDSIESLEITIIFNDDYATKLSSIWGKDQLAQKQNIIIRYDSRNSLFIQ